MKKLLLILVAISASASDQAKAQVDLGELSARNGCGDTLVSKYPSLPTWIFYQEILG